MFNRIAIMGTGSLGTILGAFLSRHRSVDLIDANREHVEALNRNGATVSGKAALNVPVHAIMPEEMEGKYDLFIYMAKQTYNDSCLPQMKAHSHADTYVCCCQNGLPEEAVCKYFPAEHVFGAPVVWGATWLGPGRSELTTVADQRYFTLGSISGEVTPALREVKALLELMCRVELSDNLMGQRWTKLHLNASYSGMSAVMGGTFGDVNDSELAVKWAVGVARECVSICKAKGIQMIPGHTSKGEAVDYMQLYSFDDLEAEKTCIAITRDMHEKDRALVASMLQDLRMKRPCEVDAIVGVVVEAGKAEGIPTPFSNAGRDVILQKQEGRIPVDFFPVEFYPGDDALVL